jgi:hypothetical protein
VRRSRRDEASHHLPQGGSEVKEGRAKLTASAFANDKINLI